MTATARDGTQVMEPYDEHEKGATSLGGPRGAPRDARGLPQPAGTGNGPVTETLTAVDVGDYVRIADGRYGYVWAVSTTGTSGEWAKAAVLVRIEEDDPAAETVPEWFDASECAPICHVHGSRERCEAVEDGWRCTRWAARTVSAILLDELWDARHEDGQAWPGVADERRAVCWEHLAAGIVWAEQRVAQDSVRIGLPEGGSYERPADIEKVSFGQGHGASPSTPVPSLAVAADGQSRSPRVALPRSPTTAPSSRGRLGGGDDQAAHPRDPPDAGKARWPTDPHAQPVSSRSRAHSRRAGSCRQRRALSTVLGATGCGTRRRERAGAGRDLVSVALCSRRLAGAVRDPT